jgi:hypothetical protein
MTANINPADLDLAGLARQINLHHAKVLEARTSVRSMQGSECAAAMNVGDYLIPANLQVDHGEWAGWLRKNTKLKLRTAARYMQLARARAVIEAANRSRETDLSISAARRLIEKSKAPKTTESTASSAPTDMPDKVCMEPAFVISWGANYAPREKVLETLQGLMAVARITKAEFCRIAPASLVRDIAETTETVTARKKQRRNDTRAQKDMCRTHEEQREAYDTKHAPSPFQQHQAEAAEAYRQIMHPPPRIVVSDVRKVPAA